MNLGSLPSTVVERITCVCGEFEQVWKSEWQPRIEEYLDRTELEGRPDLLRALLATELELRRADGDTPNIEEYLDRFPDEAAMVRALFQSTEEAGPGAVTLSFRPATGEAKAGTHSAEPTYAGTARGAEVSRSSAQPLPDRIGPYKPIRFLGEGTFGRVYQAVHEDLGRDVAIKVARPGAIASRSQEEMMLAEARLAAGLKHPSIVTVYDVGRLEGGEPYIVFEYVEGRTLRTVLKAERLTPSALAVLISKLARAVHHAHQAGLVHRDLTPANVLIDARGEPHVTDFGLALNEEGQRHRSGEIAGTPSFMAPEQVRGEAHRLDGRTDVWALGVILYSGLTFRPPFAGQNKDEVFDEILHRDPKPPRQLTEEVPRELERICLTCLAKRMSDRYGSAADLAEDLEAWVESLSGKPEPTPSPDGPRVEAGSGEARVVPRGLRAFGKEDAGFFLSLLPGPRGRDGLPESIRFWKTRVEDRDADTTFSVGLLYGPSGGGKSSLVRAGLLPHLESYVHTAFVEASAESTESQLLTAIKRHLRTPLGDGGLVDAIAQARQGNLKGGKLLIVLDQFEQWLHAHPDEPEAELVRALRQCDGPNVQALLLVRDDYWMAITRLFKALEIRLVEGVNSAPVELFDLDHSRKVLVEFGRAGGRLPEAPEAISVDAERFLNQAIREMAGPDGRVTPVRLSVFCEIVSARPWTPSTLRELGGIAGIGVRFLEEKFDSRSAPPSHRAHLKAVEAVLQNLLPAATSDIRGVVRSAHELAGVAGYKHRPDDFVELMRILDNDLRIVTLIDPNATTDLADKPSEAWYSLSHDFLVAPIRQWVARKELATPAGRTRARLAAIASYWIERPSAQRLPSPLEWLSIHWYTRRREWSDAERRMIATADRGYATGAAVVMILVAAFWFGIQAVRDHERASATLGRALKADFRNVPDLYPDLATYRDRIRHDLERIESDGSAPARDREMALLLLHRDLPTADRALGLRKRSRVAGPEEIALIRDALASNPATAGEADLKRLVLEAEDPAVHLRAAAVLAIQRQADLETWGPAAGSLVQALLAEDRRTIPRWLELLDPAASLLVPPLTQVCSEKRADPTTRSTAAEALSTVLTGKLDLVGLARAAIGSQSDAAAILLRELEHAQRRVQVQDYLHEVLTSRPNPPGDDRLVERQAMAAIALALLGDGAVLKSVLQHRSDPRLRTVVIQKIAGLGLAPRLLAGRLKTRGLAPSDRQATLMAWAESPLTRIPPAARGQVIESVRELFAGDPDPGVHSAADLLLRRWEPNRPLPALKAAPASPSATDRRWETGKNGHVFAILPGPVTFEMGSPTEEPDRFDYENRHFRKINRTLAVATTEVTVSQFQAFKAEYSPDSRYTRSPDCPAGGISWYDACRYCNWLSKEAGIDPAQWCYPTDIGRGMKLPPDAFDKTGFRLPTEAEWEYFGRSGTDTIRFFGNSDEYLTHYAWTYLSSKGLSHPVAQLLPNEFGLFDTLGGVWEWCHDGPMGGDGYDYPAYPAGTRDQPALDEFVGVPINKSDWRIARGGVFDSKPAYARSAHRNIIPAYVGFYVQGFRVVRTLAVDKRR
jgi:serine/threonine protein kinase/formylglycine-generating enzyme required for sulfatase activity